MRAGIRISFGEGIAHASGRMQQDKFSTNQDERKEKAMNVKTNVKAGSCLGGKRHYGK